jgi:hypothetical protein
MNGFFDLHQEFGVEPLQNIKFSHFLVNCSSKLN